MLDTYIIYRKLTLFTALFILCTYFVSFGSVYRGHYSVTEVINSTTLLLTFYSFRTTLIVSEYLSNRKRNSFTGVDTLLLILCIDTPGKVLTIIKWYHEKNKKWVFNFQFFFVILKIVFESYFTKNSYWSYVIKMDDNKFIVLTMDLYTQRTELSVSFLLS